MNDLEAENVALRAALRRAAWRLRAIAALMTAAGLTLAEQVDRWAAEAEAAAEDGEPERRESEREGAAQAARAAEAVPPGGGE